MNFAAIDIGTNSIRLLIAKYNNGNLNKLVNELRTPRLGEGINNGIINEQAQSRANKVLKEYKELIDAHQADYRAVATSAIRDADNKDEFLTRVKEESGIKIDVISGQEEAQLSYLGMIKGLNKMEDDLLAIDIGGGSTEFIFGTPAKLEEYKSINLGAVRLKETWGEDFAAISSAVQEKIKSFLDDGSAEMIIGVGGTITTLVSIAEKLAEYRPDKIQNYQLTYNKIEDILTNLKELTLSQRKKIIGLSKDRADIIIPGTIILLEIMDISGLQKLQVSDFGILEGIIYNKFK